MEEYEIESIARFEAEQAAEEVEQRLGVRMKDIEERIDNLWNEFWAHDDESLDIRAEVASLLEDAARQLQFCNRCEEVVEVLVQLLNDLVGVLKV